MFSGVFCQQKKNKQKNTKFIQENMCQKILLHLLFYGNIWATTIVAPKKPTSHVLFATWQQNS